jgi:hypothetical protein
MQRRSFMERAALAITLNRWKFKGWTVCGIVLVSFGAGSLTTARLVLMNQVRTDSGVNQLSLSLSNSLAFGKYSGTLNTPRVIQYGRYEF